MYVCLYVWLNEQTRIFTSLNHTNTYAWYIRQLIVDVKVSKICEPHGNLPKAYQRLCIGPAGRSCHFNCTILAAPCGAGVCLYLFLLLNVLYLPIYAKLGLVVGMTKQMSNGKE